MRALLFKRRRAFLIYLTACFFPVISDLLGAYGFSLLIGSIPKNNLQYFIQMLLVCVGITIAGVILFIASRFMRIGFMRDILLEIRVMAFDRILNLNYDAFNTVSKEVYISNLINDINIFEQNFFLKLLNIIFQGGKYSVSIAILLFYDWKFAVGTVLISVLVYAITIQFENKTVQMQNNVSDQNELLTLELSNTFNGLEILKLNQVESQFLYKTLKAIDRLEIRKFYFSIFTEGQRSVTRFLSNFVFVGMMIYLLNLASSGASLTKIAFMLSLGGGCIWPIGYVIPMFNELKASIAIFNKITNQDAIEATQTSPLDYQFKSDITLKNMSFSYGDRSILNDVNLKLEKGKKYLIKGASGTGKSTLLRVLSKMNPVDNGMVFLDGKDLNEIDEVDFNRHISFVYQDVFLFEDTIRNNITLFKPASEETLREVVEQSGLTAFINDLPDGLDTILSENGKNISGGQRQRISIARAIFKNSEILFVDEGTSSLNEELGRQIEAQILKLNTTVIAISHRHYDGVTDLYDYVIELSDETAQLMVGANYFEEAAV